MNNIYTIWKKNKKISIDTRTLKKGDIFFALKGNNFDGNQYAKKAIELGASYVVVDNKNWNNKSEQFLYTENTLKALQECASFYRNELAVPFVAITGSNGKTTTKELISSVLSKKYQTHCTKGNFNNHIGVPITILSCPTNTQLCVIEFGANHLKEIASYCSYAKPTHGLITNIGKAHIGEFGNFENIIQGKTELYDYLTKNRGIIFYNPNNEILLHEINKRNIANEFLQDITKCTKILTIKNNNIGLFVSLKHDQKTYPIQSHLFGDYNLDNICYAISIGLFFGININDIVHAIQHYYPNNQRSQKIIYKKDTYIFDTYNANPTNMKVAIKNFYNSHYSKPVYVLGAMKELGEYSMQEHQKIINFLQSLKIKKDVFLIGQEFESCQHSYTYFPSIKEAEKHISNYLNLGFHFLLKGSRALKIESIFKHVLNGK